MAEAVKIKTTKKKKLQISFQRKEHRHTVVTTEDTEVDNIVVEDASSCRKTGVQDEPQDIGEALHTNFEKEPDKTAAVDESCSSMKTESVQDEQQIGEKVHRNSDIDYSPKECTVEDVSKISYSNSEESVVEGEECGSENSKDKSEHVKHTEHQSEPDVIVGKKDSVNKHATPEPETTLQPLAMDAADEKTEERNSEIEDRTGPDLEDERQKMEQHEENTDKHERIISKEMKIESPKEKEQILPPVEIKEKFKLKIEHPKIYPRIEQDITADGQKPLTVDQLRSLYYNTELEHLDEFVDNFLQHINQDRHEFYEMVLNYYRARNHLVDAEKDVETLRNDCDHYLDMVWTTVVKSVTVQGKCADKYTLSTDLEYEVAEFSQDALNDVSKTLKTIRNFAHDELSLHAYSAQLSRLQVESYIHELYRNVPQLRDIPHNAPVRAWMLKDRDELLTEQIQLLRECIDVLFMFQRKPCKDDVFVRDTRSWLTRLVATLLRVATVEEHLWILNQILRCPAGVGKWAAGLLQVVPPMWTSHSAVGSPTGWGSHLLDHAVSVMATILLPIKKREDLMYQLKAVMSPTGEKENPWILIDSDGEEDDEPGSSWQYLHENDLVALLNQIPLADIFRHVLQIEIVNDIDNYDVTRTSENGILKLYSFASCYIQLLGQGLQHFSLSRYRQLNKRIARIIKEIVLFVSDHWENFKKTFHQLPPATLERLQVEYDQVFCRATSALLSAQRLGSWQFMVDMPYNCVSMPMMWTLLLLMHYGYKDKCDMTVFYTEKQCQDVLEDTEWKERFENKLLKMPTSEAIYLLTTFSKMAESVSSDQKRFVHVISKEIYEIAYISSHTREFCSKVGRELLSSIAQRHPFILSFLLQGVQETVQKIGMVSLYLFSELPLILFRPLDSDVILLRTWLLEKPLSSTEHQLSRLILQNMNWGVDTKSGTLFLDYSLHRKLAITLVELHQIHFSAKHIPSGGYLYDALKPGQQATKGSEEQQASNWSWEMIFRLKLHSSNRPQEAGNRYVIPDLNADPLLYPVQKSVKEHNSLASYVALILTKYGHSTGDFCSEGIFLLNRLVGQQQYVAAIHVLSHITPLFHNCVQYLTDNNMYTGALHALVNGDNAKKSLLFNEFPGTVVSLLTDMIIHQVRGNGGSVDSVAMEFWIEQLTHIPRWQHERNVLYVVDNLLEAAFTTMDAEQRMIQFFNRLVTKHLKETEESGVLSSLVSWIATNTKQPSLIDANSCPEFGWYTYHVLQAETCHEADSQLWNKLQMELYSNPSTSLDQLVKKCSSALKLDTNPSVHRLCVYRWAQQAIDMDISHPALPLVWQRFFLLYLGRPASEPGLPQRGGVGEKFFESTSNTSMLKRMKKQLGDAAEYHHKCVTELDKREKFEVSGESSGGEDTIVIHSTPIQDPVGDQAHDYHCKLVKFYQTLLFWLDEPRLHDPSLYLPALPPQYEAERLLTLFHNEQAPWLEFVDYALVERQLSKCEKDWRTHKQFSYTHDNLLQQANSQQSATERVLSRLQISENRISPPSLISCKAPVPEVNPAFLTDKQSLLYALRSDLAAIIDYARLFSMRVSKHVGVDATFIELLPSLFRNEIVESEVTIQCTSSFNPTHKCKGPALITEKHENKKRDEITSRKVDENRAESKQLMIESLLPPAQNVCSAAVHVENTISALIKLVQNSTNEKTRSAAVEVAISLFYHLSSLVSEDTRYYPPTRQFFSACIEMLGQEFIRNNPTQSQPLLQCILATPHLAGLLVPNFSPNATPELFVTMYEDMINAPLNQGPDVAFTLLTKFDVRLWLTVNKPAITQRSALIEIIGRALATCGLNPSEKMALVFEVYRSHAQLLLLHQFPDHYGDILKLLLKGSAGGQLKPIVWSDFLQNIGCPCATEKTPAAAEEASDPVILDDATSEVVASEVPLSIAQIKETLQWISSYFFQIRVSSSDIASFGLYPGWSLYVTYISKFLDFMARQLVCKIARAVRARDLEPNQAMLDIWKHVTEVLAPWIQPLDNNGQVLSPWINSDAPLATTFLVAFADVLLELYEQFKATERVLSRLQISENRISPPSLISCKAPVPEVNPAFLTDKQSLLYALRSDLAAIIDYARLFSMRVSKHVGVDATFIELLPSLFRNEIVESEVTIQCTSSFNPTHKCKGPALITEKHENKKRDEITSRKVDENRAESKQLMIESLLPPAQNVCSAAVHVENTISALIKLVQNSTNEKTRSAAVEVAISLFYHLSSLVSEDTRYYPPTRQFFSACIEMLGQEFIRNNPTQSQPLLQCILATPHLAGLLVPNFSPNATPELFVTMYEDMINAPLNQGPDVAFTLLTKFDVRLWLTVNKPAITQRSALIEIIGRALATCGLNPSEKMALVFEVYRSHAQLLLLHQFPDHYGDILKLLLKGSAGGQLKPIVWSDFLQNIGCPCATEKTPAAAEEASDPVILDDATSEVVASEVPLSIAQIKETLQWISSYFFQIRVSSSDIASFGLYPGWSLYVTYISKFLDFMARQLVCKIARAVRAGDLEPNQAMLDIWKHVTEVLAPWIQPLDNNGQVLSPWINSDAPLATTFLVTFADVLLELYEQFKEILPGDKKGVLNLVWTYYTSTLAVSGCPEHVLKVYHHHLPDLPWKLFVPDMTDLDLMIQLFHRRQNSSIAFLSEVVSVINWTKVIDGSSSHQELVSVHVTLFHLLVSLASNQDVSQATSLSSLLKEAESFNWSFLDGTNYDRVVTWFKDSCDPRCILADKNSALGYLINLLKVAAGFIRTDNMVLHPETPLKRAAYVRCTVQLVCRCSHLKDIKPDLFGVIIINLINDVEAIVGTVMDMASQHQESVTLCCEVLNLLNNCNPQGKTSMLIMDTLMGWMMSSHSSILILPMVTSAGRTLASVTQMARIVECGIEAHFQQEHPESNAYGWGWVLGAITVPEISHNEFLEECVKHGCYLTLFAYVLQKLPMSQSLQDEYKHLNYLITWSEQVKPRTENEAKLLLWFGKVIELILRQLHYGAAPSLLNQTLRTFIASLQILGEDKSHSGLLGAIGLGKKSQLSLRFRFIVRSISAYILSQLPNQNYIRSEPGAPGAVKSGSSTPSTPTSPGQPPTGPSAQASQALSQLEALRNNKTYASLREHIIYTGEYIADPQHCINDAPALLIHLVKNLYRGYPYLSLLFHT